jgi:hypothetical protein
MFLRQMIRKKDGKEHRYFSVVENKRHGSAQKILDAGAMHRSTKSAVLTGE